MSPHYAGVVRAVMRCSVFVTFVSSRGIKLVVVGLGRLGSVAGVGFGLRCWSGCVVV